MRKRTTSHDWGSERKTTAEELSVGQFANAARDWLIREVALRMRRVASNLALAAAVIASEGEARNGGGESSQDWDEGEKPHGAWLESKKRGGYGVVRWGVSSERTNARARSTAGNWSSVHRCRFIIYPPLSGGCRSRMICRLPWKIVHGWTRVRCGAESQKVQKEEPSDRRRTLNDTPTTADAIHQQHLRRARIAQHVVRLFQYRRLILGVLAVLYLHDQCGCRQPVSQPKLD
jgi:hypothetical protein